MIRTMRGRHCQVRNSCGGVPSRKGLISHKRKTVIQALDWLDLFCHFRRSPSATDSNPTVMERSPSMQR